MKPGDSNPGPSSSLPEFDQLKAAVHHVQELIHSDNIAVNAAEGILHSLISMIGMLVGDSELPEHARSGYEGLQEVARELLWKIKAK